MKTIRELIGFDSDVKISSLYEDSRAVTSGGMFFCVVGLSADGHNYIDKAIANGAVCIVHSNDIKIKVDSVVYVKVDDVVSALNEAASKFYDEACQKMKIIGVTGTNGKSTIATIVQDIYHHFEPTGYIGTIPSKYNDNTDFSPHTTPNPIKLHSIFKRMYDDGIRCVAMEVSSHGLALRRVDSVHFDCAIFTNLTHDHLDFHKTLENYLHDKGKLFERLDSNTPAIINVDDDFSREYLKSINTGRLVTYGVDNDADYKAENICLYPKYTTFDLVVDGYTYPIHTNLVAKFNVYNLLASIAALVETGLPLETVVSCLRNIKQVDARMEVISKGQPFDVIVDMAHTPDGYIKLFEYAKSIQKPGGKIIPVAGCNGNRDKAKRPIIGAICDEYSDYIIITEFDPRNEDPREIADEMITGIKNTPYIYIQSRYEAIKKAIEIANCNDIVLILGKGAEIAIDRENGPEPWMSDLVATREILEKYYKKEGREMKYNKLIDHTILKADAVSSDIEKICKEAVELDFASVCINPCHVAQAKALLQDSSVKVCTVIGFPLGATIPSVKAFEAKEAIMAGADEIDMVINIGALKDRNDDLVYQDIAGVVNAANGRCVKVIIETCLLTEEEKIRACELSKKAKATFVKTSTGFSTGGATVEDVKLMKDTVGAELEVKASGGVRSFEDLVAVVEAGATRIGTSSGPKLVVGEKSNTTY